MRSLSEIPDDRLKVLLAYSFGFATLAAYFVLAVIIALGHIEEKTSFGLPIVLGALGPLGGAFVGWAFGQRAPDK
jgi:Zn-dependent protease